MLGDPNLLNARCVLCTENHQSRVFSDTLKKIGDFLIGVAIMRICHRCSFAKQRVGFIEKEDGFLRFGSAEKRIDILLRFSDVAAYHSSDIYLYERALQLESEGCCRF